MKSIRFGIFVLLAALASFSGAQNLKFSEALDGKKIPAVIKPKDLPADFWAVKITTSGEFSLLDLYGGAAFSFRSGGMPGEDEERQRAREALIQSVGVSWTKGDKVRIEGQEFLITYRLDVPIGALGSSGQSFDMWALENPLELTLQLVRPESISKITPVPTLSPEKMAKAVEAFTRSLGDEFTGPIGTPSSMVARQTAALSNAKQISLGILMYQSDYDDIYPARQSTDHVRNVTRPYMKNDALWKTGNPNKSRFLFNVSLSGFSAMDVDSPAEMPMIYESAPWPDGRRAVAYADGHAKLITNDQWNKLQPLLKAKLKRNLKRTVYSKPNVVSKRAATARGG